MTISGGVAEVPSDAATIGGLLKAADEALRAAKGSGRNRVTRFVDAGFDEVASAGG